MKYLALVLAAVALFGCGDRQPSKTEAAAAPPVPVQTIEAREGEWLAQHEIPGTVRARTSATLSSRTMGYIVELRAEPGQSVRAGDTLARLDSRDVEAALRQAQASEQEARSAIAEADNGVIAAGARYALAETTFARMKELHGKRSISEQEFDEARARFETAKADLEMARSKRVQLNSRIEQAHQAVGAAEVMRSFSHVTAPFAGLVTAKLAQTGQLAAPGTPLLTLEQVGAYRLEAPVQESLIGRVRRGETVRVALDALGQEVTGRVDEIVPAIEPQSRSFLIKVLLPASPQLRSGMFGRVLLRGETRHTIAVPSGALQKRGELQYLLIADNGTAHSRIVTTGASRGAEVEIASGLQAGERVIYPRPQSVSDGVRVEVRK